MKLLWQKKVLIFLFGMVMLLILASYHLLWNRKVLWSAPSDSEVSSVISENNNETVEVLSGHNSLDMKRLVKTIISKLDFTPRKVPEEKDIIEWNPHVFSVIPHHFLQDIKNPCWYEEFSPEHNPDPYSSNTYPHTKQTFTHIFEPLKKNFHKLLLHRDGKQFRLRCLPYFYIIGQAKCGTTDLFSRLRRHPEVTAGVKEPHWWSRRRFGINAPNGKIGISIPVEHYLDLFDFTAQDIQSGISSGDRRALKLITGDGSPTTMWDNNNWHYINRDNEEAHPPYLVQDFIHTAQPEAKIISMLRDPTERLYSDYLFFNKGKESAEAFHQRVVNSLELFLSCLSENSLRSCVYNGTMTRNMEVNIHKGLYVVFLLDWLTVFPREQILVIRLEDYAANQAATLEKVFDFLHLGPLSKLEEAAITEGGASNTRQETDIDVGPMLQETKALLRMFHQPFNQKLSNVLEDEAYLWRET